MDMSLRDRLRRDTRATHDELENLPIMLLLMSPLVTRSDYGRLLSELYVAYERYCPHIEESLGTLRHGDLAPTQLPPFLERDLRALGSWPVAGIPEIPLPSLSSSYEALGAWYVLEGSILGGAIIGAQLRGVLGDDLPLCYLAERDDAEGNRWQRFDDFFENQLRSDGALETITAGANASYSFAASVMRAAED